MKSFLLLLFLFSTIINSGLAQTSAESSRTESIRYEEKYVSLLSCTQSDLDPCSYVNISGFISALVAELNNQLNNCPARGWDCNPSPCCLEYLVIALSSLPGSSNNPFFYCTDEDCNTFYCSGKGYLHNYSDVSYQNAIISHIKSRAMAARPYCWNSGATQGSIYEYEVFSETNGSCESGGSPCFNTEIKVKVYYSCECGESD